MGLRATVVNYRLRVGRFRRGGDAVTLTQADTTTCGAACVLAARLLLDPAEAADLAADLETTLDANLATGLEADLAAGPGPGPQKARGAQLMEALRRRQKRLQSMMNRRGLRIAPWPGALGSTPWALAAQMSALTGAAYRVRWVADRRRGWGGVVEQMRDHAATGAPVLLLTGGDPGLGLRARRADQPTGPALLLPPAIPRHYVLALPWRLIGQEDPGPARLHLYEPGTGAVRAVDLAAARDPRRPGPRELGGWPRILATIAPAAPAPPGAAQEGLP
ncbi:hypothetical protein ACSL103130_12420 [Actinomyces slackii]|uniref:Uncharacterized protein n=1 Tax=Actinomyces slackii TaxID=52774 RepID=A0A3S4SF53_9ACTO|nr:hypothetical protein [Actinomyces slackii]VEG74599.1 Uncharacterised protein [Actinomyces slackii]